MTTPDHTTIVLFYILVEDVSFGKNFLKRKVDYFCSKWFTMRLVVANVSEWLFDAFEHPHTKCCRFLYVCLIHCLPAWLNEPHLKLMVFFGAWKTKRLDEMSVCMCVLCVYGSTETKPNCCCWFWWRYCCAVARISTCVFATLLLLVLLLLWLAVFFGWIKWASVVYCMCMARCVLFIIILYCM